MSTEALQQKAVDELLALTQSKVEVTTFAQRVNAAMRVAVSAMALSFLGLIAFVTVRIMDIFSIHSTGPDAGAALTAIAKGGGAATFIALFTFGARLCFRIVPLPLKALVHREHERKLLQRAVDNCLVLQANGSPITKQQLDEWLAPYYELEMVVVLPPDDFPENRAPSERMVRRQS